MTLVLGTWDWVFISDGLDGLKSGHLLTTKFLTWKGYGASENRDGWRQRREKVRGHDDRAYTFDSCSQEILYRMKEGQVQVEISMNALFNLIPCTRSVVHLRALCLAIQL